MRRPAGGARLFLHPLAVPADLPSAPTDAGRSLRATAEQRVVLLLLALLLLVIVTLSTFGVRATLERRDARVRADRAFARAGLEQLEFHSRRGRFAFWEELAAEGMRLPEVMAVDTSNATASHWYLRLRDTTTGMLCDRIGQLSDRPGAASGMTCRTP